MESKTSFGVVRGQAVPKFELDGGVIAQQYPCISTITYYRIVAPAAKCNRAVHWIALGIGDIAPKNMADANELRAFLQHKWNEHVYDSGTCS